MSQNPDNIQNEKDFLINVDELDEETLGPVLQAALYRQDCPETMKLGEYQLGLLAEAEATQIKVHLNRCPHCQAELARLAEFLTEDVPVSPAVSVAEGSPWIPGAGFVWRQVRESGQVIIRVLEEALNTAVFNFQHGLQSPVGQPALGRLRGKRSLQTLFQLALQEGIEDLEVTVTVAVKRGDPNHCTVTVQASIPSRGGWPNLAGTEVILKQDELIIETQTTNAYGRAVFEGITTEQLAQLTFEIVPET